MVGTLAALLVFAVTPSAGAAVGDISVDQCFASTAIAPCASLASPFAGIDVEISPDGKQVYGLSRAGPSIHVFDRGQFGKLTPRPGADGCYDASGGGCTVVPGFGSGEPYDLEMSADGRSIYVATSHSVAHLRRDPASGSLTPMPCYGAGSGCTSVAPNGPFYAVAISPDGESVYTRGEQNLGAFQRDPADGTLIPEPDGEDCFKEAPSAGCSTAQGLAGHSFEMTLSADGSLLYYPIQIPGGVGFFKRAADGTLSQILGTSGGCITTTGASGATPAVCSTATGGGGMANALATTISPSGRYVFVSGGNGTVVFSRDSVSGVLSSTDCIAAVVTADCDVRSGSAGLGVSLSPDGKRAIVNGNDIAGIGVYDFDEATGTLTQLPLPMGCFSGVETPGCGVFPGGGGLGKTAWAPDGLNFYTTSFGPLVNMAVDAAPTCQSSAASLVSHGSSSLALSCTDLNGDPVTARITRGPSAGALGAIDQAASSVLYTPRLGYLGQDSFAYVGTARGVDSAEVTVSLDVQRRTRLNNRVVAKWKSFETYTTLKRLVAVGVPDDASLRLTCKGAGCPFAIKSIDVKKAGNQKLTSRLNPTRKVRGKRRQVIAKLRAGTVVELQIDSADRVGKAVRFKMRKGKKPLVKQLCTPPGSAKAKTSC